MPAPSKREQFLMTAKLAVLFGAGIGGLWLLDQLVNR